MKTYNDFIIEQNIAPEAVAPEAVAPKAVAPEAAAPKKINIKKYNELLNKLTHFWYSLKISLGDFGHLSDTFLSSDGNEIERNKNTVREYNNKIRKNRGNRPKTKFVKIIGDNYYYEVRSIDDNNNTAILWNLDVPLVQNDSTKVVSWDKIENIVDKNELNVAIKKKATINPNVITKPKESSYCKIKGNNNIYYKVLTPDIGEKRAELLDLDKKTTIKVEWRNILLLTNSRDLKLAKDKDTNNNTSKIINKNV